MKKTTDTKTVVGRIDADVLAFTVGKDPVLDLDLVAWDCYGSAAHVTFEYLKLRAKIEMLHVPYRGTAPSVSEIGISGNLQGGPGAMIVVPVMVNLPTNVALRSLQFRAEVAPVSAGQSSCSPAPCPPCGPCCCSPRRAAYTAGSARPLRRRCRPMSRAGRRAPSGPRRWR